MDRDKDSRLDNATFDARSLKKRPGQPSMTWRIPIKSSSGWTRTNGSDVDKLVSPLFEFLISTPSLFTRRLEFSSVSELSELRFESS